MFFSQVGVRKYVATDILRRVHLTYPAGDAANYEIGTLGNESQESALTGTAGTSQLRALASTG